MPNILSSAYGIQPKSYNMPGIKLFPTQHPFVKNEKGSVSNVVLSGEDILDNKGNYLYTIAFPTMINGERYTKEEAFKIAQKQGIEKYPRFSSPQEMNAWAEKYHGSIDEKGVLAKGKKPAISELVSMASKLKTK